MRFLAISLIFALSCNLCLALSVRQSPAQPTDNTDPMKTECTRNFEIISHDTDYQRLYACIGNQIVPLRCRHCLRMEPNSNYVEETDANSPFLRAKEQGCLVVCGDNSAGMNQVGSGMVGGGLSGLGGLGGMGQQNGIPGSVSPNSNQNEETSNEKENKEHKG